MQQEVKNKRSAATSELPPESNDQVEGKQNVAATLKRVEDVCNVKRQCLKMLLLVLILMCVITFGILANNHNCNMAELPFANNTFVMKLFNISLDTLNKQLASLYFQCTRKVNFVMN